MACVPGIHEAVLRLDDESWRAPGWNLGEKMTSDDGNYAYYPHHHLCHHCASVITSRILGISVTLSVGGIVVAAAAGAAAAMVSAVFVAREEVEK